MNKSFVLVFCVFATLFSFGMFAFALPKCDGTIPQEVGQCGIISYPSCEVKGSDSETLWCDEGESILDPIVEVKCVPDPNMGSVPKTLCHEITTICGLIVNCGPGITQEYDGAAGGWIRKCEFSLIPDGNGNPQVVFTTVSLNVDCEPPLVAVAQKDDLTALLFVTTTK